MGFIWVLICIIFAIAEGITQAVVGIWFVAGAIGAFIAYLLGCSELVQVIVFISVSVLSLMCIRPLIKSFVNDKKDADELNEIAGKTCEIKSVGDNMTCKVDINGVTWNAYIKEGTSVNVGEMHTIESVKGNRLIVCGTKDKIDA